MVARHHYRWTVLVLAFGLVPGRAAEPPAGAPGLVDQPVHEYFTPFGADGTAADRGTYGTQFTHLGTDFGGMGPAADRIGWASGGAARVDLRGTDAWAGLWHSLAGAG